MEDNRDNQPVNSQDAITLKQCWFKVARRLQEYASHQKRNPRSSYSCVATIMRIEFILDSDGNLVKATSPTHISLEGRNDAFDAFIKTLVDSCT